MVSDDSSGLPLISNGFQPTHTLVFAFGFDEEISGTKVNRCLPGGCIIKCSWSVSDRVLPILPPYSKNSMKGMVLLLLSTKEVFLSTKCPRKPVEIGLRCFWDSIWHSIRSSRAGGEGEHECPDWGYCTRWAFEYTTWTYGKLLLVDAQDDYGSYFQSIGMITLSASTLCITIPWSRLLMIYHDRAAITQCLLLFSAWQNILSICLALFRIWSLRQRHPMPPWMC